MIPAAFDYVRGRPRSPRRCRRSPRPARTRKVLAGGQSLIPVLRLRLAYPTTVVDVGRVDELRGVRDDGDAIVIGAMTTHHDVLHDPLVTEHAPLHRPGHRHRRRPAGAPPRHVRRRAGARRPGRRPRRGRAGPRLRVRRARARAASGAIAAADFFVDYLTTALAPDEVLTAIRVPKLGAGWGSHYEKFNRVAQAWSIVGGRRARPPRRTARSPRPGSG